MSRRAKSLPLKISRGNSATEVGDGTSNIESVSLDRPLLGEVSSTVNVTWKLIKVHAWSCLHCNIDKSRFSSCYLRWDFTVFNNLTSWTFSSTFKLCHCLYSEILLLSLIKPLQLSQSPHFLSLPPSIPARLIYSPPPKHNVHSPPSFQTVFLPTMPNSLLRK